MIVTEFLEVSIEYVKNLFASNMFIPSTEVRSAKVSFKSIGNTISMIHPAFKGNRESNSSLNDDFS